MFRDGVLVREEGHWARGRGGFVEGWDEGEEVLVPVKVLVCGGDDAVEGVDEAGVVVAEGELVDDVAEVKL